MESPLARSSGPPLRLAIATISLLTGACAHERAAPAAPSAAAPAIGAPANTAPPPVEPSAPPASNSPRFRWPPVLELEVTASHDETLTDGTARQRASTYLLEYERLADGRHRFWEGGPVDLDDRLHDELTAEVAGAPSLVEAGRFTGGDVVGIDVWRTKRLAALARRPSSQEVEAERLRITGARAQQWRDEELMLEWMFPVSLWARYLEGLVMSSELGGTPAGAVPDVSGRLQFRAHDAPDEFHGAIEFEPSAVRVEIHYRVPAARAMLPLHFYSLVAPAQANDRLGEARLHVVVDADRWTLLPRRVTATWELAMVDAAGTERVGRREVVKTYVAREQRRSRVVPLGDLPAIEQPGP